MVREKDRELGGKKRGGGRLTEEMAVSYKNGQAHACTISFFGDKKG